MDPQPPPPPHSSRPHPHSQSHGSLPPLPTAQLPLRTANTTPASSPGPLSPLNQRINMHFPTSEGSTPAPAASPLLHPLQNRKVRETHKALVDTDYVTGRKVINRYEIIDELGRGVHGKVKLARNKETGENVAIKIIPRFSKKRKLGKISTIGNNRDKSKREIAILKKIRHPNVVALLEVIDDPELSKIYMVLEHVELGEVVWRKKGLPEICAFERRRVEREMRGEQPTEEEIIYEQSRQRLQALKNAKRARMSQGQSAQHDYWSLEYGTATDGEDNDFKSRSYGSVYMPGSRTSSLAGSRATSRAPSRNQSFRSVSRAATPHPSEPGDQLSIPNEDDLETPSNLRSNPASSAALDASVAPGLDEASFRDRSPSMADSIISHMSSLDYNQLPDPYADDFSYVPCFTIETARSTFRDTVLGLEYLHYEGIIHRDIKPANLLWTRDHRVKISDFGVSYFGRPIRDGEPDDTVSESEAQDFDNDLELAKTVGTPAFFAPELCYTDSLDALPGQSQPKITEQIDVWSLGVTLYCLIFARIPFLGEDEWQMFRKIATEEVHIPTKRLKPVDPSTKPVEKSLYTRYNDPPYRDDNDLAYEDIDPDLQDLLRKMLTKHPDKRIRLREVKRHQWVTKDLPNVLGWIDDTDPSRRASGQKIHVDAREVEEAVVPVSIFERARSAVKKAVDKVMHPRGDRAESSSRKRATSSVGGSGENTPVTNPSTPFARDFRRRSLRGDRRAEDYFASLKGAPSHSEHPLTHSVVASPQASPMEGQAAQPFSDVQLTLTEGRLGSTAQSQATTLDDKPLPPLPHLHHAHTRSISTAFPESSTVPATPCYDGSAGSYDDPSNALRKARDMRSPADDASRARSVDRASLFASSDKRAEAKVSLSTAVVPGSIQLPPRPPVLRTGGAHTSSIITQLASPLPVHQSSRAFPGFQQSQLKSAPNVREAQRPSRDADERPTTAHRIQYGPRAAEQVAEQAAANPEAAMVPCPPSPAEDRRPPSREETVGTAASSNSASLGNMSTPLTSPSETASPMCIANPMPFKGHNAEQILAFQSDPSLPALLSSTSSVSADLEGDFLGNPGVPSASSVLETTDSLTPPALAKEDTDGFPLEAQEELLLDGRVAIGLDSGAAQSSHARQRLVPKSAPPKHDDDDDTDSDEGLTMGRSRKNHRAKDLSPGGRGRIFTTARRRDTNGSARSTDTAKKMVTEDSQTPQEPVKPAGPSD